jgi:hypothetical protein
MEWGQMKIIRNWLQNKPVFFSSIGVFALVVTLGIAAVLQPSLPMGASSNDGGSSQTSNGKGDASGNEKSKSRNSSGTPSPSGTNQSTQPSPTSSAGAVAAGETQSQAEAKQRARVLLTQEYQYFRPLFSRNILKSLLQDEGFSASDAAYAAGAVSHNWSAEAEAIANAYISDGFASRLALITVLGAEQFNSTESNFAAARLEADNPDVWLDEASSYFDSYPDSDRKSKVEALAILTEATFTSTEAAAVVGRLSSNFWEDSATLRAMDYYYGLQPPPGYQVVVDFLRAKGYSQSEIDYAMPRIPLSPDS